MSTSKKKLKLLLDQVWHMKHCAWCLIA